jgi:O-antigen/teichoic acid export membrane protein
VRRVFVTNLLFVIAVNALVKPAYVLGIDRAVQVRIGPASFGIYQALVNLGLMFNVLLDFGLASYNVRMVSLAPQKLAERLPPLLTARILLSVLFSVVVFSAALLLGYKGAYLWLLAGILLIQCLSQAHLFFRSCFSGLHLFKVDSLLSVADRLLMLGVCAILFQFPQFSLRWFVGAQGACYAVALVAGMVLLHQRTGVRFRFSLKLGPVWAAIRETMPYALLTFLMSVYLRADAMLIERLASPLEAGRYAAAYRLLDVGHMFGLTFASLLLPLYGRQIAEKTSVAPLVTTGVSLLLPVAFTVAAAGLFFGGPIMQKMYGPEGIAEAPIFTVLMWAFPALCLTNIYSTLLTAAGKLKLMNSIAAVACVISLIANFFLIPQLKSLGGAWATFITQWAVAIGYVLAAQHSTGLPLRRKATARLILFAGSIVALGWGTAHLPLPWILNLALLGLAGISLMFAFGMVSIANLKQLFQK